MATNQASKTATGTNDLEAGSSTSTNANGSSVPSDNGSQNAPSLGQVLQKKATTWPLPSLDLHVFRIDSDAHVEQVKDAFVGLDEALATEANTFENPGTANSKTSAGCSFWIDIDAEEQDREEVNRWIEKLNFGTLITNTITKPTEEWLSHVVSTRLKSLIMIRILPLMREDGSFHSADVEFLAAVKTKRVLLTYTISENEGGRGLNNKLIKYMTEEDCLQDGSSNAALISLLEFHVFRTRKILTKIKRKAMDLAARLDQDPSSVLIDEIAAFKKALLLVISVTEEQCQCLGMIRKMDQDTDSVDFLELEGSLSILLATAESTERMGARLEKEGEGIKHAFDSNQQDRINHRLAVLTVVSAVFMPLTFLAGLFGMNFVNIPGLDNENGYFILLGSMAAIAISMLAFFQWQGWFS